MKTAVLFCLLIIAVSVRAQNVGIGTKTPQTRLHVIDSLNDVRVLVESPVAGSEAFTRLLAGNNPFSFFQFTKYAPGATGSFAGISKDNLSLISTGGNAGPMLLATGDGVSPIIFATGTGERMRITGDGKVAIGTTTPATANNLQVHSNDATFGGDVSIGITNTFTTDASGRGARFRMNAFDLAIINNEPTGRISLSTNFNQRLVILPSGNIGINNLNPAYLLDIESGGSRAVNINQTGSNSYGVVVNATAGNNNNTGVFVFNTTNYSAPNNYAAGVHAISGSGAAIMLTPTTNYGLIGECRNPADGFGVLGVSNSPSPEVVQAGVKGINFSTAASAYGVIGSSNGSSGAGTVGYTGNATAGLLGYAHLTATGPAIKSVSLPGSSQIGLELENGAIKVSGASPTAFRHIATAGNIFSNETIIPNTTLANNSTDMLFVTAVWNGVYVNAPLGVYFTGGTWRIFRQDLAAMPVNAIFNVLVVKQ